MVENESYMYMLLLVLIRFLEQDFFQFAHLARGYVA